MATFQVQLEDIAGGSSVDTTAMSDWLTSGARTVLNMLPLNKLKRVSSQHAFVNTADVEGRRVLTVTRNDGTIDHPCREVLPSMRGRVIDSNYMEYATNTDPVYYIDNQLLTVKPDSSGSNQRLTFVNSAITVAYSESSIDDFPDEAEHAVVLFAARNYLQRLMNNVTTSLSDLSIVAVAPAAPAIGTVSYSDATNADASATEVANILVDAVTDVDPSGSVPTFTAPALSVDVSTFSTFLEIDEDTELASLQLGRLNNEVSQYQANIQNEVAKFNKENVRYQAELQDELTKYNGNLQRAITKAQVAAQKAQQEAQQSTQIDMANKAADQVLALQNAVQNMQATIQNNNALIGKYTADLQEYGAEVQKEVQEYTQNLQKDGAQYGWYVQQYQAVDAQYKEQLQLLQGGK